MTNIIKNFFENLTNKQILGLVGSVPFGFFIGITLNIGLAKFSNDFEKYNTEKFSVLDSSKIDTLFLRTGEFNVDTLIDYYALSKKEISFKSVESVNSIGFLSVKNKEASRYRFLKQGIPSEEVFEKNNEIKNYYLIDNFIEQGFELNKLDLTEYKMSPNFSSNFYNAKYNDQKGVHSEVYTRENSLGNKVLDNEISEVKNYLDKILEYKESLKD